ncbi:MAG: DNA repair exonuclease [bacterium]|nr:DNA repair exonuclease [bacterium]
MHIWKVICVGDLHLGRMPGGLSYVGNQISVDVALTKLVDEAIEREVHAVCFSGDILDRTNAYFEAAGQFERAVRQLRQQGIEVICVSGNHDWNTLPSLRRIFSDARLLGGPGEWGSFTLPRPDESSLQFVGYCFPADECQTISFSSFPQVKAKASIGLLHCDVGQMNSRYGGVELSYLTGHHLSAWSLGHIHKRTLLHEDGPFIFYSGSLQPLHINERGVHGAELLEISAEGKLLRHLQLPLATIYFDECRIDLSGEALTREEVLADIREALFTRLESLGIDDFEYVGIRVILKTDEQSYSAVESFCRDFDYADSFIVGRSTVYLESLVAECEMDVSEPGDYERLLTETVALLSGTEFAEGENAERGVTLVDQAQELLQEKLGQHFFQAFSDDVERKQDIRRVLVEAGVSLHARIVRSRRGSNVA